MIDQLILGDAVENAARLPAGSVPLTVTSPPYDDLYDLGKSFAFEPLARQLWRITAPGGIVCWNVQDRVIDGSETGTSSEQRLFFRNLGFRLHETIIVFKEWTNIPYAQVRHPRVWQYVYVLSKGRPQAWNPLRDLPRRTAGKPTKQSRRDPKTGAVTTKFVKSMVVADTGVRTNVWSIKVGGGVTTKDRYTSDHPGRMPEALARDLILTYSKTGDLVFDPMNGLGTTTKMALLNHRSYLGIEIDPRWHSIALRRIAEAEVEYQRRLDEWLGGAA